jgi:hypothetical protein
MITQSMEIGLRLLMNDGVVHITFQPPLTGEQYTELLDATQRAGTRVELRMVVRALTAQWGTEVRFEDF